MKEQGDRPIGGRLPHSDKHIVDYMMLAMVCRYRAQVAAQEAVDIVDNVTYFRLL